MSEHEDLIEIRLKEHYKHMLPRIHNKWMQFGFEDAYKCEGLPDCIYPPKKYFEGKNLWYNTALEIRTLTDKRFDKGFSIDYIDGFIKI